MPIATLQECDADDANALLREWRHKMGPLRRGDSGYAKPGVYVLLHESQPLAVATHSTLIRETCGGGLDFITRDNGVELSRLCAVRPGLCRVMLRMWRELIFPQLGYEYAISYQDADMHNGNTYRFDGWKRSPRISSSGTDTRASGLAQKGRRKWVWYWQKPSTPSST